MNEQNQPFLSGYSLMRLPIVDGAGVPVWPAVFPLEKIDRVRDTVGPRHFSSQMMLEYISEDKARLDPGALHFYSGEFNPRNAKIVSGRVEEWKSDTNNAENFQSSTLPLSPISSVSTSTDAHLSRHDQSH